MAKTNKVTLIDGTGHAKHAPAPKKGLLRAIYLTMDAIGGFTSLRQVLDLLPAAIEKSSQVVTPEKVLRALKNGVYRGYFISQDGVAYKIAPLEYYNVRRAYCNQMQKESRDRVLARGGKNKGARGPTTMVHTPGEDFSVPDRWGDGEHIDHIEQATVPHIPRWLLVALIVMSALCAGMIGVFVGILL